VYVVGQKVYSIDSQWQVKEIGELEAQGTGLTGFWDNGVQGLLVDSSPLGYTIDVKTGTFARLEDPSGFFQGGSQVTGLDTFLMWSVPGTNQFQCSLSNTLSSFDPLYFAAKTTYPDLLQNITVNNREVILLGEVKSELWYNAGNPGFPFAELPGAYLERGTSAPWSMAGNDKSLYFLSQTLTGQGMVHRLQGYQTHRVSNHALEVALRRIIYTSTLTDAIGYCYQQDGHEFYVLTLPSADQTWVFDEATMEWHQRGWTDKDGNLHRERANCSAVVNGQVVVGDWENGTLYAMDLDYYFDTVGGVDYPIPRIRTFPHIGEGLLTLPDGQIMPSTAEGRRLEFSRFLADLECGGGELDSLGNPPMIGLRWSNDRGKTFGNTVLQSAGRPGQYDTQPQWTNLGFAQDRVWELSYSFAGEAALNGAWCNARILGD
jgi:hypothetical protein